MSKPTIAYVAQFFPILTETFVYREVGELREKGFNVVTLSNRTPDVNRLSDEAKGLMAQTTYVFPIQLIPFLTAHLYFLLRHPLRYLKTFLLVMAQPGESMSNRKRTLGHFAGAVRLARAAQAQNVQHVHAHFAVNAATIGLVISKLLNIPYSFTAHNIIFTDKLILKQKLAHAQFIVAISEYSKQYLLDYAPEIPNLAAKFHIVHCGISPEQFRPKKPYLNGNGPQHQKTPLIFSLARTDEKKGMPYLVEACRILRDRGVDFKCIIGGDGDEHALLQRMVAEYGLDGQVELPGTIYQENLDDYLTQADMFVLACITAKDGDVDGIPVVLMESMAMELPTISTSVSGIPELIINEESGLLVPEKDPHALADMMQSLIENPDQARELGQNGREKVCADFNIHRTSDQLTELFNQYVN